MQTKKITFKKLQELILQCNAYLKSLPEKKKTALSIKIRNIGETLDAESVKCIKSHNKKIENIRIDHCSIDGEGNMLIREGAKGEDRFTFKPDKLKAMRELIDHIDINEQECNIETDITHQVPKTLTYEMAKAFRGILIPEDYIYQEIIEEETE